MVATLVIQPPVAAQAPLCQGIQATIVGTTGADTLVGTPGNDVIVGLGGADMIMGRGGADLICSGWGADTVFGGDGNDSIFAGPGWDEITGGAGDDVLAGGPGRDTLIGNTGGDQLSGGAGPDSLMGGVGADMLRGGAGFDRLVGGDGADSLDGGEGNDTCSFTDANVACEMATLATRTVDQPPATIPPVTSPPATSPPATSPPATSPPATSPPATSPPTTPSLSSVERVIHISIDGLRSDYVTDQMTPTLTEMQRRGTSTLNARNDPALSNTLPNHTAQLTGRPVAGVTGHGVDFNEDSGGTVHDEAGTYVSSVLDVAHDHGLVTAMYAGKEKFDLHERSWNGTFGAPDQVGANNGRNKIDIFDRDDPADAADKLISDLDRTELGREDAYIFFHIRLPDTAGHAYTWGSPEYDDSVRQSDAIVRQIRDHIKSNPAWADSTAFVVTADHGGPLGETSHFDITDDQNYRIPFIVEVEGAKPASDLYVLNPDTRTGPRSGNPSLDGEQPIRGHEAGNLSLQLLGLPPIPGSTFNALHDLALN